MSGVEPMEAMDSDRDGAEETGWEPTTPTPCERISLSIASTTSPTVCVRESAATSCASTLSCFCTSLRISTRLIESTPSSVSSAMSISIISGSYPVLAASTASTVSVAFSDDTPGGAADGDGAAGGGAATVEAGVACTAGAVRCSARSRSATFASSSADSAALSFAWSCPMVASAVLTICWRSLASFLAACSSASVGPTLATVLPEILYPSLIAASVARVVRGALKVAAERLSTPFLTFSTLSGVGAGDSLGRPTRNGLGSDHGSKRASGTPCTANWMAAARSCMSADTSLEALTATTHTSSPLGRIFSTSLASVARGPNSTKTRAPSRYMACTCFTHCTDETICLRSSAAESAPPRAYAESPVTFE